LIYRVAELPEIKMPLGNLAKVFGPTIVGYSNADIDATTMLKETKKQQVIVETLLNMSSKFWKQFVNRPTPHEIPYNTRSRLSTTTNTSVTPRTHGKSSNSRKIYFTEDSPKEVTFARYELLCEYF
jgi:Rac GTPase-activating protein 1